MTTRVKYNDHDRQVAYQLLQACAIPRDQLPYTPAFDALLAAFRSAVPERAAITLSEFWRLLSTAAKRGGLAKAPPTQTRLT